MTSSSFKYALLACMLLLLTCLTEANGESLRLTVVIVDDLDGVTMIEKTETCFVLPYVPWSLSCEAVRKYLFEVVFGVALDRTVFRKFKDDPPSTSVALYLVTEDFFPRFLEHYRTDAVFSKLNERNRNRGAFVFKSKRSAIFSDGDTLLEILRSADKIRMQLQGSDVRDTTLYTEVDDDDKRGRPEWHLDRRK